MGGEIGDMNTEESELCLWRCDWDSDWGEGPRGDTAAAPTAPTGAMLCSVGSSMGAAMCSAA